MTYRRGDAPSAVPAVQTGDVQTGDVQTGDVQTGDVQTGDVQTGDMQTDDVQTGDMQTCGAQINRCANGRLMPTPDISNEDQPLGAPALYRLIIGEEAYF